MIFGKIKRCGILSVAASALFILGGCSVFISTPRVTHIQIQGMDDQLRKYVVQLEDPAEDNIGIQLSDRYTIQFDFEWLWNTGEDVNIYNDLNLEHGETGLAPWMLCKYRF